MESELGSRRDRRTERTRTSTLGLRVDWHPGPTAGSIHDAPVAASVYRRPPREHEALDVATPQPVPASVERRAEPSQSDPSAQCRGMATDETGGLGHRDRVPRTIEVAVVTEVAVVELAFDPERGWPGLARPSEPASQVPSIVSGSAARIAQDLVGANDPLERPLGGRVGSVHVGVVAAREGAIRGPNRTPARPRRETEDGVRVDVAAHIRTRSPRKPGGSCPGQSQRSGR